VSVSTSAQHSQRSPRPRRGSGGSRAGRARSPLSRPGVTVPLRLVGAAAGGLLTYLSNAPRNLWWLAPIGLALLALVTGRRKARAGFGYGVVFGVAFFLPLLAWLLSFLGPAFGPWPWLAVSVASAVLFALLGAAMAVTSELPGAAVWAGGAAVAMETIRAHFPFDGFPWGRIAFTQPGGPLVALASIGGAPLVTFSAVVLGVGLARCASWRPRQGRAWRAVGGGLAAVLVPVVCGLALLPVADAGAVTGHRTVGVVQGSGPDAGLELLASGDVFYRQNQRETTRLAADIAAGRTPRPDLVIYPESSVNLRGTGPAHAAPVAALARIVGAPVAVGARALPAHGPAQNVVVGWQPGNGPRGGHELGRYAKQKLVPFSEYIPLKSIAQWVTPFVGGYEDMKPGHQPGVIDMAGTKVGFAICYEVAYDQISRGAVRDGAQLLAVPTDNAWFGHTQMTYQQLAMSRLRAVEHDRTVVVAASTGASAIIRPNGTVVHKTGLFTPAHLVASVPLKSELTVADRLGAWPEWLLGALGLGGVIGGTCVRIRRRRRRAASGARP
jgi:apolipoprotein N-acyltransferase